MRFGVVTIGRNEGDRLRDCLASLPTATAVVYVDSGSSDGSPQYARTAGVEVVELDMSSPFTAARARNAGFGRLRKMAPSLPYVQFLDGDCLLVKGWPETAVAFLDSHPGVGAVCGRRRERYPERSIYNWLCDQEWMGPAGEVSAFGGDVLMRADALERANGYREDLIAGEDPELSVRLRAAGWHIWRLDAEMTLHDAAITRLAQWWRRAQRGGYAFAEGAHLHGGLPERHFVWEARRAWIWGIWLPLACIIISAAIVPWGLVVWLIYPLQVLRQTVRNRGPFRRRALLASFQVLARFPEAIGQIQFLRCRLFGRRRELIEYK